VKETLRWRTSSLELKGLSKKLGEETWDIMKSLLGELRFSFLPLLGSWISRAKAKC
jgi:hypothetical protein